MGIFTGKTLIGFLEKRTQSVRILIVEDRASRVKKFKQNLVGTNVYWAKTSERALELLKEKIFDYIFLDYDIHGPADEYLGSFKEVYDYLLNNQLDNLPKLVLHTLNDMERMLWLPKLARKYFTLDCPFAWQKVSYDHIQNDLTVNRVLVDVEN